MGTAVLDPETEIERYTDDETRSALAIAFFRAFLYDLVLCEDEIDAGALRQWEEILRGGPVRDYAITRYYRAIAEAKRRARNPANIAAYLVYRMSHGGHPENPNAIFEDGANSDARRCIGCSAPIDEGRRARMVERIDGGYRLADVRTPFDCEDLVGTHLTQEDVSRFVGHEVSFSYQGRMIERIYEELEQEESRSWL